MFDAVNWTALSFGLAALSFMCNGAIWVYLQVQRKHAATDEQVRGLDGRMVILETKVNAWPDAGVFADIREHLADIRGDVKASASEIHGLGAGLKRVEGQVQLLMENELKGQRQ